MYEECLTSLSDGITTSVQLFEQYKDHVILRVTTSQEVSWNRSGGITTKGVNNWSPMFIKTVFKTTFGLSNVLKITFSALNHVNNIRGFTSNMWFDFKRLSSTTKSILITAILNKRTDGATSFIAPERAGRRPEIGRC